VFSAASRASAADGGASRASILPGQIAALVLVVAGAATALSIDLVETGGRIKGDEATYVSMALSAAADGDLVFERVDLDRFWRALRQGPEGIFLKTGPGDRLYYGKAYAYSVAAVPFVWLAGVNGLLLFNVLLLAATFLAAYAFLAARTPPTTALLVALAFLGASIVPLYIVWLTSEIFNFALIGLAYFLWFYKEVAPARRGRWADFLRGIGGDVLAAILFGIAVYSKPPNLPLIAPVVIYRLWRREWRGGMRAALVAGLATASAFGLTGLVSGDMNYQGGGVNRKTYYGRYPFDAPDATLANRGTSYATDTLAAEFTAEPGVAARRFAVNVQYFLLGRYTGLLAYYFPAVVVIGTCLLCWRRVLVWQWLILGAVGMAAVVMLLWLPFTWAGGGGAPGNRYFLSLYPALLFVLPPVSSVSLGIGAWAGALFMAPLLVNPFVTSLRPWQHAAHGLFRWLPVEVTMANDLPIMIDPHRGRVPVAPVAGEPEIFLYFLDDRVSRDPGRMWVAGGSRTEIIVRAGEPLSTLRVTLRAPVANRVWLGAGRGRRDVQIAPDETVVVAVQAMSRPSRAGHAHLLSIETETGFVPHLVDPASNDRRFLGVEFIIAGHAR
jgi:hypothetical protein